MLNNQQKLTLEMSHHYQDMEKILHQEICSDRMKQYKNKHQHSDLKYTMFGNGPWYSLEQDFMLWNLLKRYHVNNEKPYEEKIVSWILVPEMAFRILVQREKSWNGNEITLDRAKEIYYYNK